MTSAFAADHAAPAATTSSTQVPAHDEHAADAHGAFYTQAEFWVAVAFFIVVGFAFKKVSRAIGAALDTRAERIRDRLAEAHRLREDAQKLLEQYQTKQREAMKEAEEIMAHARAEAQRQSKQAMADLEESIKRREAQALTRIAQAEAQAKDEVRNVAIDLALAATGRLIADNMSHEQSSALIDQAIKDLPARMQ